MQFSILGNGMVGTFLHKIYPNSILFGRQDNICEHSHDTIVVAGPNGKRHNVEKDPLKDKQDCDIIIDCLLQCEYNNILHLSTIDVIRDDSAYAENRIYLEKRIAELPRSYAMRIGKGIAPRCQRNILWDLQTNQWLSSINLQHADQWYPLSLLPDHIYDIVSNQKEVDIYSSDLIKNYDIVNKFFPHKLPYLSSSDCKLTSISNNLGDYHIPKEKMWQEFDQYMFDLR